MGRCCPSFEKDLIKSLFLWEHCLPEPLCSTGTSLALYMAVSFLLSPPNRGRRLLCYRTHFSSVEEGHLAFFISRLIWRCSLALEPWCLYKPHKQQRTASVTVYGVFWGLLDNNSRLERTWLELPLLNCEGHFSSRIRSRRALPSFPQMWLFQSVLQLWLVSLGFIWQVSEQN